MKGYRQLTSVLLGLLLLLQGVVVSSAPRIALADMQPHAGVTIRIAMHCDMRMVDASGKPSCCDAQCPDMTTCLLGAIATDSPVAMVLPRAPRVTTDLVSTHLIQRTLAVPLRPPITLHG